MKDDSADECAKVGGEAKECSHRGEGKGEGGEKEEEEVSAPLLLPLLPPFQQRNAREEEGEGAV